MQMNVREIENTPVKNISSVGNSTRITFCDGRTLDLNGSPIPLPTEAGEIQSDVCCICGKTAMQTHYPLYTLDNKHFVCRDCIITAYITYREHNIPMPSSTVLEKKAKENIAKYKAKGDNKNETK